MEKRHFNQGEVMPEIPNNAWGETIWYMDLKYLYKNNSPDGGELFYRIEHQSNKLVLRFK